MAFEKKDSASSTLAFCGSSDDPVFVKSSQYLAPHQLLVSISGVNLGALNFERRTRSGFVCSIIAVSGGSRMIQLFKGSGLSLASAFFG